MLHGHDGYDLSKSSQHRQVLRLVRLAQPAVVIIVPELGVSALARIDVRQHLKNHPESERFVLFPPSLWYALLYDRPVILDPLFHQ